MRMNLVFFIVFLFSSKLFGITDYSEIDKKSVSIPDSLKTAEQISAYLTKDLKNDIEKARAFYIWISHNINYDLENKGTTKRFKSKAEVIDDVLKTEKGYASNTLNCFTCFVKNRVLNLSLSEDMHEMGKRKYRMVHIPGTLYKLERTII